VRLLVEQTGFRDHASRLSSIVTKVDGPAGAAHAIRRYLSERCKAQT
jgi:hypothetical protein